MQHRWSVPVKNQDCGCSGNDFPTSGRSNLAPFSPTLDASRTLFRVGQSTKVSDALHALSFIKGSPVIGTITGSTQYTLESTLSVQVQHVSAVEQPLAYGLQSNDVVNVASTLAGSSGPGIRTFNLGRIGGRARLLTIDQSVTAPGSTQDYADVQLQSAAIGILRRLDREIGQGQYSGSPSGFDGLSQLAPSRIVSSTGDFAFDMRLLLASVTPNGSSGTGESIDCLFGGPLMLRKLMALSQEQGGIGTWAHDTRTGRTVFHYMGIPYYRTQTEEQETEAGGLIFAANLGPTGLQMIHAYGSAESFGVAVQETPVTSATGAREVTVHGAWALVLWEPEALAGVSQVNMMTGL